MITACAKKSSGSFLFFAFLFVFALFFFWGAQKANCADYRYHEVVQGETVESIADHYGVSVNDILCHNSRSIQESKGLMPGTVILVPLLDDSPGKLSSENSFSKKSGKTNSGKKGQKKTKKSKSSYFYKNRSYNNSGFNISSKQSKAVSSDGTSTVIPTYVPPVEVDMELDENSRSSMSSRSGKPIRTLVSYARRYLGVPYVWGGTTPMGFDCSGYVQYVYGLMNIDIPRTADVQFNVGRVINPGSEAPGDMVFFETYAPGASHVGIYLGGGEFIHASSSGCVRVSRLDEDYFSQRYLGARRLL